MAKVVAGRSNHHRELLARARNFPMEVAKNEDGTYTAKVSGQDVAATGKSESDAIWELKETVKQKFLSGELEVKQTFF